MLITGACHNPLWAQDSSRIRISLLTCTPGEELYSTFGHSALRISDSSNYSDWVFNFGTFNFEEEGFYLKFIQGKLRYYLSAEPFADFRDYYKATGRGITEQELRLTSEQKKKIKQLLITNLEESNRYYLYDFFFDNCTTRLRDIIVSNQPSFPELPMVVKPGTTFRNAIHAYLNQNQQYWSKLGIDLLLGAPTDAVMNARTAQFLPDNLLKALDSCDHSARIQTRQALYPFQPAAPEKMLFTPLLFFSILLCAFLLLSMSARGSRRTLFLAGADGLLFFLTGLTGIALIFMWTGTNHAMCRQNYNLLWAIPFHSVMAFFIRSKQNWARYYFGMTAISSAVLLLLWFFLPQQLNYDFIPLVLLIGYRAAAMFYNTQSEIE